MKRTVTAAVFICIFISACSTRLAYDYLDWILEWYVADLVNLTEDQEWQLNDAVTKALDWHRKQQLPVYTQSLEELSEAINNGLSVEILQQLYIDQETAWRELKLHAAPLMAKLFSTMNDNQIKQLLANLEDRNQELEEDYVNKPHDERIKQRTERMVDRIENWTGTLNATQVHLIEEWSRQIKPISSQWIANRRDWQSKLGKTIHQFRHTKEFSTHIENLFMQEEQFKSESYESAYQYNLRSTMTMFVNLEKQLSKRQRQHLLDEISVLRKQLYEIYNQK